MKKQKSSTCPTPKGILLIIGGNENKNGEADNKMQEVSVRPREILETFIKLTQKKEPCIEVITTASSESTESYNDYKRVLSQLGVTRIGHIHHMQRAEALKDDLINRLNKADGIFFTGGDQLKLTSIYGGTKFLTELKNRYIYEDIVIGGTSAGAMAFSTPMIYAGSKELQQITGEVKVTTGLEFLKDVCIDTHFVDRSRFVRIAQVISTNPTCIGVGIEEDTALIIRNGLEAEIIGSGIVTILEGFNLSSSNVLEFGSNEPVHIENLRVHLLSKGCNYLIPGINPPHI